MTEEERHELVTLRQQAEDAHNRLDILEVPRKTADGSGTYTLSGRLEWLMAHAPGLWETMVVAQNAEREGKGLY